MNSSYFKNRRWKIQTKKSRPDIEISKYQKASNIKMPAKMVLNNIKMPAKMVLKIQ